MAAPSSADALIEADLKKPACLAFSTKTRRFACVRMHVDGAGAVPRYFLVDLLEPFGDVETLALFLGPHHRVFRPPQKLSTVAAIRARLKADEYRFDLPDPVELPVDKVVRYGKCEFRIVKRMIDDGLDMDGLPDLVAEQRCGQGEWLVVASGTFSGNKIMLQPSTQRCCYAIYAIDEIEADPGEGPYETLGVAVFLDPLKDCLRAYRRSSAARQAGAALAATTAHAP